MLFKAILEVVLPVYLVIAGSYVYGRRARPDLAEINRVNMQVFIPCLIFGALANTAQPLADSFWLCVGVVLINLGSGAIALLGAPLLGVAKRTLLLPVMFCNAGNVGIPVMLLTFGPDGLMPGVILLVMQALVHMSLGVYLMDRSAPVASWLFSPILLATVFGAATGVSGVALPTWLLVPIQLLGQVASPLMLFSLGVRLVDVDLGQWRLGLSGALLRPAAGMTCWLVIVLLLPLDPGQRYALLIFAVLPPAVMNFMLAERFQQEPETVASMILVGHLVSAITLSLAVSVARTAL